MWTCCGHLCKTLQPKRELPSLLHGHGGGQGKNSPHSRPFLFSNSPLSISVSVLDCPSQGHLGSRRRTILFTWKEKQESLWPISWFSVTHCSITWEQRGFCLFFFSLKGWEGNIKADFKPSKANYRGGFCGAGLACSELPRHWLVCAAWLSALPLGSRLPAGPALASWSGSEELSLALFWCYLTSHGHAGVLHQGPDVSSFKVAAQWPLTTQGQEGSPKLASLRQISTALWIWVSCLHPGP